MIEKFLNIKESTRNLSDEEFEDILPILAEELSHVDVLPKYNYSQLESDWSKLCHWLPQGTSINSTSRLGMKLCEHFFPNFYNIKDHKNRSFLDLWKDQTLLMKILKWNRKSHSTPYLSELKRGIYFCGGLAKSTMYRPQMAKLVTSGSQIVLDPCCGWGGRMLGSVANGCEYYGFEPNTETYNGLIKLAEYLNITDKVNLFCDDALNMNKYDIPDVDCILTSPPYFNLEVYCDEESQSITNCDTYDEWVRKFLSPLIGMSLEKLKVGGKSCWNVAKIKQGDMWEDVIKIHKQFGFIQSDEYSMCSSKRQVNGSGKSYNKTISFVSE